MKGPAELKLREDIYLGTKKGTRRLFTTYQKLYAILSQSMKELFK